MFVYEFSIIALRRDKLKRNKPPDLAKTTLFIGIPLWYIIIVFTGMFFSAKEGLEGVLMSATNENANNFAGQLRKRDIDGVSKQFPSEEALAEDYANMLKNLLCTLEDRQNCADFILEWTDYCFAEQMRSANPLHTPCFIERSRAAEFENLKKEYSTEYKAYVFIDIDRFCSALQQKLESEGFFTAIKKYKQNLKLFRNRSLTIDCKEFEGYNIGVYVDWLGASSQARRDECMRTSYVCKALRDGDGEKAKGFFGKLINRNKEK